MKVAEVCCSSPWIPNHEGQPGHRCPLRPTISQPSGTGDYHHQFIPRVTFIKNFNFSSFLLVFFFPILQHAKSFGISDGLQQSFFEFFFA